MSRTSPVPLVRLENVHHIYAGSRPVEALRGVSLALWPGEHVAVIGPNGSGKSTLARHLNALLLPTAGDVWVKAWNTKDPRHLQDVRATVGMVFQHPDAQIVATVVEEDVAFGPENLGLPRDELRRRVDWALDVVGMSAFRRRPPHWLSGGQKQRVALAGAIAMRPELLVLDEATALLDPIGRRDVLNAVMRLNRREGMAVVTITHFMEEAALADRVVVMCAGEVVLDGPPHRVFGHAERLRAWGLDLPPVTQLAHRLHALGFPIPPNIVTVEALVEAICRLQVAQGREQHTQKHS